MVWNTSVAFTQMLLDSTEWKGKDVVQVKESVDVTAPVRPSPLIVARMSDISFSLL